MEEPAGWYRKPRETMMVGDKVKGGGERRGRTRWRWGDRVERGKDGGKSPCQRDTQAAADGLLDQENCNVTACGFDSLFQQLRSQNVKVINLAKRGLVCLKRLGVNGSGGGAV